MDQSSRTHKKKCCCKKKRSISCATIPSWMNKLLPRSSRSNQGTERIIGGKEAESPIPWQVQFKPIGERPETFCGGTILDKYTILSAAHCISCREITKDPSLLTFYRVIVGSLISSYPYCRPSEPGCGSYKIKKVIIHPKYDSSNEDNDFCIIKLTKPIVYNKDVRNICLPPSKQAPPGQMVVSGWGLTKCK